MLETSDISVKINPGEGKVHRNQVSSRAGNCDYLGAGEHACSEKGYKLWAERNSDGDLYFSVFPWNESSESCVTTEIMAKFYLSV